MGDSCTAEVLSVVVAWLGGVRTDSRHRVINVFHSGFVVRDSRRINYDIILMTKACRRSMGLNSNKPDDNRSEIRPWTTEESPSHQASSTKTRGDK